jgi:hypothetical protein
MNPLETLQEVGRPSIALCDFPERQIYSLAWDSLGRRGPCMKQFLHAETDAGLGGEARLCREPQVWRTQARKRIRGEVM